MGKREDMTGWVMKEHGVPDSLLTVVCRAEDHITTGGNRYTQWLCNCECGNQVVSRTAYIKSGNTKSCGCLTSLRAKQHIKILNQQQITHNNSNDRLYGIWINMKHRCNNINDPRYDDYGGRGISICDEWVHSYENFRDWSISNGYSEYLSIDRIDVNGNYEPSNCRWATNKEQQNNMRSNRFLTYNGETHTISEWAEITGINKSTISKRINRSSWPIERALTTTIN